MDKIEIGEFVRTKNNGIKRIDTIFENKTVNKYGYECGSDWDGKWYSYIKTTDIVKHSKNIIDLIEYGDIVEYIDATDIVKHSKNIIDLIEYGDIVEYIDDLEDNNEYIKSFIVTKTELQLKAFKEYLKSYCKIISILTKQQYEQNCYVVESEVKDE